ncbi:hypothetical protein [Kribbella sp. NBC_00359]|uniref:hypothetical protein n=1 Tax=Kribbella sp. NBC_00359 TaxID=2975966 RepID=UPI002E1A1825
MNPSHLGTAWETDPNGRIIVSYDSTVTGAKLAQLTGVTKQFGDRIKLEKMSGKLMKYIAGGDAIYGGQYRMLARLQHPQRQHVLLPDRRTLREHRIQLVLELQQDHAARDDLRVELPRQRLLRDRQVQHVVHQPPRHGGPVQRLFPGHHLRRQRRRSASRSSAAVARQVSTAARSPRSTPL